MRHILLILGIAFVGLGSFNAYNLRHQQLALTDLKEDYAEITKVNYGLFNMQLWRQKAMEVFDARIKDFEFSKEAYDGVEVELEKYLYRMYDRYIERGELFDQIFDAAEREGKINKMFLKLLKDNLGPQIKKMGMKGNIPSFANELTLELQKNEPELKGYVQQELTRLLVDVDPASIRDRRVPIYSKYGAATLQETKATIKTRIAEAEALVDTKVLALYLLLLAGVLIATILYKAIGNTYYITLLTLVSIVFLALGVSLPMIDIDARLNDFGLSVLGTEVSFDEQALYYQSKSILDVTWTLIEGRGVDLKIVGVMILAFSIVIPLLKLILSMLYLYVGGMRASKLVRTIIFYLGKWSMADVFVVALFMAYIGFQGLVTSQLGDIGRNQTGYAVETINYSRLSPGALFFTTYCILSIVIGTILAAQWRKNDIASAQANQ